MNCCFTSKSAIIRQGAIDAALKKKDEVVLSGAKLAILRKMSSASVPLKAKRVVNAQNLQELTSVAAERRIGKGSTRSLNALADYLQGIKREMIQEMMDAYWKNIDKKLFGDDNYNAIASFLYDDEERVTLRGLYLLADEGKYARDAPDDRYRQLESKFSSLSSAKSKLTATLSSVAKQYAELAAPCKALSEWIGQHYRSGKISLAKLKESNEIVHENVSKAEIRELFNKLEPEPLFRFLSEGGVRKFLHPPNNRTRMLVTSDMGTCLPDECVYDSKGNAGFQEAALFSFKNDQKRHNKQARAKAPDKTIDNLLENGDFKALPTVPELMLEQDKRRQQKRNEANQLLEGLSEHEKQQFLDAQDDNAAKELLDQFAAEKQQQLEELSEHESQRFLDEQDMRDQSAAEKLLQWLSEHERQQFLDAQDDNAAKELLDQFAAEKLLEARAVLNTAELTQAVKRDLALDEHRSRFTKNLTPQLDRIFIDIHRTEHISVNGKTIGFPRDGDEHTGVSKFKDLSRKIQYQFGCELKEALEFLNANSYFFYQIFPGISVDSLAKLREGFYVMRGVSPHAKLSYDYTINKASNDFTAKCSQTRCNSIFLVDSKQTLDETYNKVLAPDIFVNDTRKGIEANSTFTVSCKLQENTTNVVSSEFHYISDYKVKEIEEPAPSRV